MAVVRSLMLCAGLLVAAGAVARAYETQRVVIVVIDGPRDSEFLEHPLHAYIPHIWNELRPQGCVSHAFYNRGRTATISGHASLASGTLQNLVNDGSQRPTAPLLWEYLRDQTGAGDEAALIVTHKPKLRVLSYSECADYGAADSATVIGPLYDDGLCVSSFKTFATRHRPVVSLLALAQVDVMGHECGWQGYVNAIRMADSLSANVWNWIQAHPAYRDRTAFFITADHGRHRTDWCEQGDSCAGCTHLPLVALGPDFHRGWEWDAPPADLRDICATAAELLGIAVPHSEGRILHELFRAPAGVPAGGGWPAREWSARGSGGPWLHVSTPALGTASVCLRTTGDGPFAGSWRMTLYDLGGRVLFAKHLPIDARGWQGEIGRAECGWPSGLTWLELRRSSPSQVIVRSPVLWLE